MLIEGLPGDAAVWRNDALPPIEERLAQLLERADAWSRALFQAQTGAREIQVPGEVRIIRPGTADVPRKHVETDVKRIMAFFASTG